MSIIELLTMLINYNFIFLSLFQAITHIYARAAAVGKRIQVNMVLCLSLVHFFFLLFFFVLFLHQTDPVSLNLVENFKNFHFVYLILVDFLVPYRREKLCNNHA